MSIHKLATQLARPVSRGYLTLTEAHTALLNAACQAERDGPPYDPVLVWGGLKHLLDLSLEAEQRRRDLAALHIRRRLKPLIVQRKPRNVLLAEAHDVNGSERFPFAEPEVADIVVTAVYWATPQGVRRHG